MNNQKVSSEDFPFRKSSGTLLDSTVINGGNKSTYLSHNKVIIAGPIIQHYYFPRPLVINPQSKFFSSNSLYTRTEEEPIDRSEEYKNRTSNKAFNNIKRLINANFHYGVFITLTFDDRCNFDIKDLEVTNKELNKFFKRLRYYLKSANKSHLLKYIWVVEFQDENRQGVIHYHFVSNIDFIPHTKLSSIWKHGYVWISKLSEKKSISGYITKYITKNNQDIRLDNHRSYGTSKSLTRPTVLYGYEAEAILSQELIINTKPQFTNSYDSKFNEKVDFKEYNTKITSQEFDDDT